jgi:glycerol-3-phosphate dehydrogenase (NAD(P)+)
MKARVSLLGSGDIAYAMARMLVDVELVCSPEDEPQGPTVHRAEDWNEALEQSQVVVLAAGAEQLAALSERYGPYAKGDHVVLTAARGLRAGFELPHDTIRRFTCARKIAVFGGPLHAQEVTAEHHATVVLASRFSETVRIVDRLVPRERVSIEHTTDLVGVGVAGAYGHITSVLTGMGKSLGWTPTAVGLLVAHGMVEARKLGVAAGGDPQTFQGIVGWGELIPRTPGRSNRHLELGEALVKGGSWPEGRLEVLTTLEVATRFGRGHGVSTPVGDALRRILEGSEDAASALSGLLKAPLEGTR